MNKYAGFSLKAMQYQNLFSYNRKSFEMYLKFSKNYCLLIAELL